MTYSPCRQPDIYVSPLAFVFFIYHLSFSWPRNKSDKKSVTNEWNVSQNK